MVQTEEYNLWNAVSRHDDRKSFDRIYLALWEKLYAIAWNRTHDQDVAKDLVQEVFVAVWEKRKQLKINGPLSQYLVGALKYRLLDYFQAEQIKRTVFERAFLLMEVVADERGFD